MAGKTLDDLATFAISDANPQIHLDIQDMTS